MAGGATRRERFACRSKAELWALHGTGPSGCGRAIAAALADGGGAYKVAVPWSEVGRHSVAITLHGAHVAGSPFTIDAITQVPPRASRTRL